MDLTPRSTALGEPSEKGAEFTKAMSALFQDPDGLRVAWRLPIALGAWIIAVIVLQTLLFLIPGLHDWLHAQAASGMASPGVLFLLEGPDVVAALATMTLMAKIEGRSFADYYLPGKEAFGKRFWQGLPFGFLMMSLLMAVIGLAHGFSFGRPEMDVMASAKFGLLYLAGFILVGLFEEASFRGYLQATLEQAMGFWPAAVVLAAMFGATHLGNTSETMPGAVVAGCFGLFEAFVLLRTGNLWFAIGIHAGWDWAETFFYSAPDSGIVASDHLTNSSLHGPIWLTGGTSGPEASAFCILSLVLATAVIHFLFPKKTQTPAG
jgi:membrane protease YdiL (CAAX protease family)